MMAQKRKLYGGLGLLIGFVVVLVIIFSPVFNGLNGLEYLDSLYNSISKGSAYYIPKVKEESAKFTGNLVNITIIMLDKEQAAQTALLFKSGGAEAILTGDKLMVTGDLGKILENCIADANAMYKNEGEKVSAKYGYNEKQVLVNWWKAFREMDKELNKQKRFKEAKVVSLVKKKAVESSYNYYNIEPQKISDRLAIVIFSLVFYVIYTLWYGFAIMFIFEGWGLRLGH